MLRLYALVLLAGSARAGDRGRLTVNVAPADATVHIDGQQRATGSLTPTELPVGTHTVDVALPGHLVAHHVVEVTAGATACLSVTLERASRAAKDPTDKTSREARGALAAGVIAGVATGATGRPPLEQEAPDGVLPSPVPLGPVQRPAPPPGPSAAAPPWEVAVACPEEGSTPGG